MELWSERTYYMPALQTPTEREKTTKLNEQPYDWVIELDINYMYIKCHESLKVFLLIIQKVWLDMYIWHVDRFEWKLHFSLF